MIPGTAELDPRHPYAGRQASLATRHGKERAVARPFRAALGWRLHLADGFDTDRLGTFSGEVPRPAGPEETCRRKALRGMESTGLRLGLASEGSFGPHPAVPLLPVGWEWMTFIDRDADLVICESLPATRTNWAHRLVPAGRGDEGLDAWLERIGFPSHAVLVRPHRPEGADRSDPDRVMRGLQDPASLRAALEASAAASADRQALLETDMRAHLNPTRMASIRRLAFRLARRIAATCPACGTPGWGRINTIGGLPCQWCGAPTAHVLLQVVGCGVCSHREERPRSDGRQLADPEHCPRCNP